MPNNHENILNHVSAEFQATFEAWMEAVADGVGSVVGVDNVGVKEVLTAWT